MYDQLLTLDTLKINFDRAGMNAINIVLALVMFGVALGIKPKTLYNVFRNPRSVLTGLLSQWILLPALTFLLAIALGKSITPMVAMGMILVASCPGGNISNFITSLSRGNSELSVSLTAITTCSAVVTTPANFAIWGGLYIRYVNRHAVDALQVLHIPLWDIFMTVFILLGIPLVLGILTVHFFPKFAHKIEKPLRYLSILFFIAMVVLAFRQNLDLFVHYLKYIFLIVFVHNLLALMTGYLTATAFKLPAIDRRTLTIETGIQNSGLGLILLFNPSIFPPDLMNGGMMFVTAWWAVWHIVSGLAIASVFRLHDFYASRATVRV